MIFTYDYHYHQVPREKFFFTEKIIFENFVPLLSSSSSLTTSHYYFTVQYTLTPIHSLHNYEILFFNFFFVLNNKFIVITYFIENIYLKKKFKIFLKF